MTQSNQASTQSKQQPGNREEWQVMGDELVANMKKLLHEGNVRRVIIKYEGHTALEIPLTVGVVGTLVAPWLAALGAMGALLAQCSIEVVRTDSPGAPPPTQG